MGESFEKIGVGTASEDSCCARRASRRSRRRYLGKDDPAYLIASMDEDERTMREGAAQTW